MDSLKIGYDAKRAVRNNTGLGNYSRLIIESLAKQFPQNHHILYAPDWRETSRLKPILEHDNIELKLPSGRLNKMFSSLWRIKGITKDIRRDNLDLFHGLSNELPINIAKSGIPSVVTIHDVIFRHFPQYYKAIDRKIYDYKFAKAAQSATRVIAISECTKNDLIKEYGIDPAKIDVVYQGCDTQFARSVSDKEIAALRQKYGINTPYIVSIGTVEQRKNQLLAVKSLKGLPTEISLVIVGRQTSYANEIKRYISKERLENRVIWIEGAPFNELPIFYRGALFSSYTSRYEGFGLPVIESLSAKTPVIVATGSCLEEAGGKYTPSVNPNDTDAFIEAATRLIDDENYRSTIISEGNKHIMKFSPANFTQGTMDTYMKAIAQFK